MSSISGSGSSDTSGSGPGSLEASSELVSNTTRIVGGQSNNNNSVMNSSTEESSIMKVDSSNPAHNNPSSAVIHDSLGNNLGQSTKTAMPSSSSTSNTPTKRHKHMETNEEIEDNLTRVEVLRVLRLPLSDDEMREPHRLDIYEEEENLENDVIELENKNGVEK